MQLHQWGIRAQRIQGTAVPGDPPVIAPRGYSCTCPRGITSKSILFDFAITMSRLCFVFESCSVMCFFCAVDVSDPVLSVFQIIVVDLIVA